MEDEEDEENAIAKWSAELLALLKENKKVKKHKSAEEKEKWKSKTWELVEQFCKEGFDLVKPSASNIDKNIRRRGSTNQLMNTMPRHHSQLNHDSHLIERGNK